MAPAPAAEAAPKKKKKKAGGKKKQKGGSGDDALDKRVIAAVLAVAAAVLGFGGFLVYDAAFRPGSIIGTWEGSRLDFEIGKPMIVTKYKLVLDEKKNASMTLQEKFTSTGTYVLQGNLLKMQLKGEKDEDGEEGMASEPEYKVKVGRSTLDLFEPATGKKVAQLLRSREKPSVGAAPTAPSAPSEVAGDAGDADADAKLASVEFSPKDGAFKLRYPPGWETKTGSRPDNTYSWAKFWKGSANIQVYADIQGSLMSGSDSAGQHEEGSEFAPVHRAHELYKKTASELYSDYNESKPVLFKGAGLGEGRISSFTASSGGPFGSKLSGYRMTVLSKDRRVSVICDCPQSAFEKTKPTFLAVCRSLGH
jgi:hypothetical protein